VVVSANVCVKPDAVLVNGKPERHLEGAYYIEWHENGKPPTLMKRLRHWPV
jgi:hypothetical protein